MAILDIQCTNCKLTLRDVYIKDEKPPCPECGSPTQTIWLSPPATQIFQEQTFENISWEPMRFSSKRKLKAELKERGLTMPLCE